MILAMMLKADKDALVCDLAETYHIYDHEQLPLDKVAVFAYGLPNHSRIKMKMSEMKIPLDTMLMAQMVDLLNMLLWSKTEDAMTGVNRPKSIFSALTGDDMASVTDNAFASSEDFEKARAALLRELGGDLIGNRNS